MSEAETRKRTTSGKFRKGHSGNPKGRPKKSRKAEGPTSAYDIIMDKSLTLTRQGVPCNVSVEEALQHQTLQRALDGDKSAGREVLRMILKREQALARRAPKKGRNVEICVGYNPENANNAVMLLGIGRRYDVGPGDTYDRWNLEPWAVQAALHRRRGGSRLTDKEVAEIKQTTWDPETIVWPRGTID